MLSQSVACSLMPSWGLGESKCQIGERVLRKCFQGSVVCSTSTHHAADPAPWQTCIRPIDAPRFPSPAVDININPWRWGHPLSAGRRLLQYCSQPCHSSATKSRRRVYVYHGLSSSPDKPGNRHTVPATGPRNSISPLQRTASGQWTMAAVPFTFSAIEQERHAFVQSHRSS